MFVQEVARFVAIDTLLKRQVGKSSNKVAKLATLYISSSPTTGLGHGSSRKFTLH